MVLGANWNGARAFTATSGPGISLMSEFIGLAYYAEVPAVIVDVQRVGPSTGMPTRTQQCDLMLCAYASHGDTKHVMLFRPTRKNAFYMMVQAFDLAERLQTPVFLMSDLDIGMNDWMCPELKWDDSLPADRGKVLSKEEIEALPKFHRYLDKDDDGIPYRTLPGVTPKGAYFTRGSAQPVRRLHRGLRRVQGGHGPPVAQVHRAKLPPAATGHRSDGDELDRPRGHRQQPRRR